MRRCAVAAVALLLLVSHANAEPAASPFGSGIQLREIDEDNQPHVLASSSDVDSVDINSIVTVHVDPLAITASLSLSQLGPTDARPLDPAEAEQRAQLIATLDALNADLNATKAMLGAFNDSLLQAESPEFNALVRRHGLAEVALVHAVEQYLNAKYVRQGSKGPPPDEQEDALFAGELNDWSPRLRTFLQAEIAQLDQESTTRLKGIESGADKASFEFKGHLHKKATGASERIHLPGYDSVEEGEYRTIDKVSFSVSEDQKKKLETELGFNRDLAARLNRAHSLAEAINRTLDAASAQLRDRVKTVVREAESAARDVQRIAVQTADDNRSRALRLRQRSNYRAAQLVEDAQQGLDRLSNEFQDYSLRLSTTISVRSELAAAADERSPIAALEALEPLAKGLPLTVHDAQARFDAAQDVIASSITVTLQQAASDEQEDVKNELTAARQSLLSAQHATRDRIVRFQTSQIAPLLTALESMRAKLSNLRNARETQGLSSGMDSRLIEEKSILKSYQALTDTKVSLPNTAREDGDTVELSFIARKKDDADPNGSVIGERKIALRVRKFGAYSELSSGAAAFFGTQPNKKTDAEFGAVVAWVLHRRSRDSKAWNLVNPGIGIHTAGITSGLGIGASLHLFPENFVQIGGGRTMRSSAANQWYWFIGLRLLNLKLPTGLGS